MSTALTPLSSLPALTISDPIGIGTGMGAGKSGDFQQALVQVTRQHTVQVQEGDTLIGLIKTHFRQNQQQLSEPQAMRLAQQVATSHGIRNPDLIHPGQVIRLGELKTQGAWQAAAPGPLELNARQSQDIWQLNQARSQTPTASALAARAAQWPHAPSANEAHGVLDRTLARAVDKGFVSASEVPAVKNKVLALAERYNFQPDDLAPLTLV